MSLMAAAPGWDWQTWGATLLGIGVTILLFVVGYARTIGAHRERLHSANMDVERIIVKRVVSESYEPSLADLARLVEGKAQEHSVKVGHLSSPERILTAVYTRIVESDMLSAEQRNMILQRLDPAFQALRVVETGIELPSEPGGRTEPNVDVSHFLEGLEVYSGSDAWPRQTFILLMALVTTMLGAASVLLVGLPGTKGPLSSSALLISVLTVFVTGATMAVGVLLRDRYRETQEEPNRDTSAQETLGFESQVVADLMRMGAATMRSEVRIAPGRMADIEAQINGRKILIEVKGWRKQPPLSSIRLSLRALNRMVRAGQADEGILVTRHPLEDGLAGFLAQDRVRVMDQKQLVSYLQDMAEGKLGQ